MNIFKYKLLQRYIDKSTPDWPFNETFSIPDDFYKNYCHVEIELDTSCIYEPNNYNYVDSNSLTNSDISYGINGINKTYSCCLTLGSSGTIPTAPDSYRYIANFNSDISKWGYNTYYTGIDSPSYTIDSIYGLYYAYKNGYSYNDEYGTTNITIPKLDSDILNKMNTNFTILLKGTTSPDTGINILVNSLKPANNQIPEITNNSFIKKGYLYGHISSLTNDNNKLHEWETGPLSGDHYSFDENGYLRYYSTAIDLSNETKVFNIPFISDIELGLYYTRIGGISFINTFNLQKLVLNIGNPNTLTSFAQNSLISQAKTTQQLNNYVHKNSDNTIQNIIFNYSNPYGNPYTWYSEDAKNNYLEFLNIFSDKTYIDDNNYDMSSEEFLILGTSDNGLAYTSDFIDDVYVHIKPEKAITKLQIKGLKRYLTRDGEENNGKYVNSPEDICNSILYSIALSNSGSTSAFTAVYDENLKFIGEVSQARIREITADEAHRLNLLGSDYAKEYGEDETGNTIYSAESRRWNLYDGEYSPWRDYEGTCYQIKYKKNDGWYKRLVRCVIIGDSYANSDQRRRKGDTFDPTDPLIPPAYYYDKWEKITQEMDWPTYT